MMKQLGQPGDVVPASAVYGFAGSLLVGILVWALAIALVM